MTCDFMPPIRWWDRNYTVDQDSFDRYYSPIKHQEIEIYTDGSHVGSSTGSGLVMYEGEHLVCHDTIWENKAPSSKAKFLLYTRQEKR